MQLRVPGSVVSVTGRVAELFARRLIARPRGVQITVVRLAAGALLGLGDPLRLMLVHPLGLGDGLWVGLVHLLRFVGIALGAVVARRADSVDALAVESAGGVCAIDRIRGVGRRCRVAIVSPVGCCKW